jgi:site-specific recombinase XerC
MDRGLRARVLLAEAQALGVTISDLIAAARDTTLDAPAVPTVAQYVETIGWTLSVGTVATYRSYWRLAIVRFGDRPVDQVGVDECEAVVADAVARAQGRRPGSDGRSSRASCVAALRGLFGRAERAGLVARSPAGGLTKPRRRPSRRRGLDDDELAELLDAVRTTSNDPELDLPPSDTLSSRTTALSEIGQWCQYWSALERTGLGPGGLEQNT